MKTFDDWRIGFAKQAMADLFAMEKLSQFPELPECQYLHFLQMACEKICKAHLCGQGSDPATLHHHDYIAKILPIIARQPLAREVTKDNVDRTGVIKAIRSFARKIELLSPAVKDGGRCQANCEYPWEGPDNTVRVPAEYKFRMDFLYQRAGTLLLKVLQATAKELAKG